MREKHRYTGLGPGTIIATTDLAVLFRSGATGRKAWIPRSQLDDSLSDLAIGGEVADLYITEWWHDDRLEWEG